MAFLSLKNEHGTVKQVVYIKDYGNMKDKYDEKERVQEM